MHGMLDTSMLDAETGSASTTGFTYSAQYGVRRASDRADVYRTQFGSLSADEYLTPMIQTSQRNDGNVARRLSRYSFFIPPQTLVRRATDGMSV
ncbi:unnamed protein product [Rotaria sp. Silwood1]|nr:unnamed protein product [Rotaria sp. Silwood1]CAF3365927.1 unnamed protein product [Rotaria sp. Silwood1]CAF3402828.1 unnamed protein product [Rotaria sp. Silwood1]CAF3433417.1 unnamed protein product [Rotaria sp. Silwood1]CAF4594222.1 unnamed protein product [Rotaria sp. Silwood1]